MTERRGDSGEAIPGDAIPASGTLLRLAAFTTDPAGGNPAGVWIGRSLPGGAEMRLPAGAGLPLLAPGASRRPARHGHCRHAPGTTPTGRGLIPGDELLRLARSAVEKIGVGLGVGALVDWISG